MKNLLSHLASKGEIYLVLFLIIILFSFSLITNAFYFDLFNSPNAFPELAWSFLHGQTHFLNEISNIDLIKTNGQAYWHMPPFPAIILIPAVFIWQKPINHNFINIFLNAFLFFLIYSLAKNKFHFSKTISLWLAILYLFSSIYISNILLNGAYYFAHIIATILIILSLYEFLGKKRFWLIGLLIGLVFLTRFTAGLTIIFYCLVILFEKLSEKNKLKQLVLLLTPVLVCLLLLGAYNYLRFNNFLETGYTLTSSYQSSPNFHPYGQFSIKYIPTNFYYFFLESFKPKLIDQAPFLSFPYILPNRQGALSFFLISPLFIILFKSDLKNKIIQYLFLTSGLILIILLSYYYNGFPQIGPRYINDFLPLLFIIMLFKFKETNLTYGHKLTIVISSFLNFYLFLALINAIP